MIFTPSDKEKKDYSQVEGWNAEKGQVIRTVKVLVESLKEGSSWTTQEKEENTDQDDQTRTRLLRTHRQLHLPKKRRMAIRNRQIQIKRQKQRKIRI